VAEVAGDHEAARSYYEKALTGTCRDYPYHLLQVALARIYLRSGEKHKGERLLSEAARAQEERLRDGDQTWILRIILAMVFTARNNHDEAYRWLNEAIDVGWRDCHIAQVEPAWNNLRKEPRFQELMAEVKVKLNEIRQQIAEID
jgi:tetratricopeptide (TPR) repeat protein